MSLELKPVDIGARPSQSRPDRPTIATDMTAYFEQFAAAYVRGMIPDRARGRSDAELLALGPSAGLKLHRFKRTMELPRVRAVLGRAPRWARNAFSM